MAVKRRDVEALDAHWRRVEGKCALELQQRLVGAVVRVARAHHVAHERVPGVRGGHVEQAALLAALRSPQPHGVPALLGEPSLDELRVLELRGQVHLGRHVGRLVVVALEEAGDELLLPRVESLVEHELDGANGAALPHGEDARAADGLLAVEADKVEGDVRGEHDLLAVVQGVQALEARLEAAGALEVEVSRRLAHLLGELPHHLRAVAPQEVLHLAHVAGILHGIDHAGADAGAAPHVIVEAGAAPLREHEVGDRGLLGAFLEQAAGARQQARGLQQPLAVGVGQVDVRADEVDDAALRVDVLDGESRLLGHRRRHVDDVQRHVADRVHESLELDALHIGSRIAQGRHPGLEIRLGGDVLRDLDLLQTVQDHREVAVGHFEDLDDPRGRADLVHVVRRGVLDVAFALQHGAQNTAFGIHGAHEVDALVAAHRDGRDGAGEKHRRTQRENGYDFGHFDLLHRLVAAGHDGDHAVIAVEQLGDEIHVVYFDGFDLIFFAHRIYRYIMVQI